jgi:peptidoglycan/LPS O-acetylase OafA/YrhL
MQGSGGTRYAALDGLRGWAALCVLVFHLFWEVFGVLFPVFRTYPFKVIADSHLGVALFFVLSGYVLTRARWARANDNLALTLAGRYLRLVVPILATALIVFVIGTLDLARTAEAGQIVNRARAVGDLMNFHPTLIGALQFSFLDVFYVGIGGKYDPFLWTMTVELAGSFIVLTVSQFKLRAWQPIVLTLIALIGLRTWTPIAPMAMGALLALRDSDQPPPRPTGFWAVAAVVVLLLVAAVFMDNGNMQMQTQVAALGIVYVATGDNPVSRFLAAPFSKWLGHLSFPIFLMQFPVIVTLTSALIVVAHGAGVLSVWAAAGICLASIGATFALAYVLVPIDALAIRLSRLVRNPRPKVVALAKSS